MKLLQTKNCIICGKKPTFWSGHVHYENKTILAGFCKCVKDDRDYLKTSIKYCRMKLGCFGKYKKKYGMEEDTP